MPNYIKHSIIIFIKRTNKLCLGRNVQMTHTADMFAPGTVFIITLYISPPGVGVSKGNKKTN